MWTWWLTCSFIYMVPARADVAGAVPQLAGGGAFGYPLRLFAGGISMLETTLTQLERLIDDLLQQNRTQQETISRLEGELAQLRDENDTLQLTSMEQEEQLTSTLERLQAILQRSGAETVVAASE